MRPIGKSKRWNGVVVHRVPPLSFAHWEKVAAKRSDEGRVVPSAQAAAGVGTQPTLTLSRKDGVCAAVRSSPLPPGEGYRPRVLAWALIASSMRQGSDRACSLVKRITVQPRASMACWRRLSSSITSSRP